MQQKLIILLLIVMVINSVAMFCHPAYKYYKTQAETLREDYVKFERKVRDDFVPVITNFFSSVPRGTISGTPGLEAGEANHSKSPSQTGNPMRHEKDDAALEKRLSGIKREIEGSVGYANDEWIVYVQGHILRKGDKLYGYPILNIDPCAIDIGYAIISVKPKMEKKENEKPQETIVVPYCPDNYSIDVW